MSSKNSGSFKKAANYVIQGGKHNIQLGYARAKGATRVPIGKRGRK